jgi:NitT/TauT family transport system substrate-binding protein
MSTVNLPVCVAVAALLLAAAGAGNSPRAQTLKPWRHGFLELKSDAGFVLMPFQHQLPAKYGLTIDTVQFRDGALALKALVAGKVDSIEGEAGEGIIAAMRGADVRTVGCPWPKLPQALFVRGAIGQIEDLRGKAIATAAPGSPHHIMMRTLLEKNSIPVSAVTLAAVGGDLDRHKALAAGIVDGAVVSSEYLAVSPPGIGILAAARDVLPDFMRLCLNITGKTIGARRDDAVRFLAIQSEGLHYAFAHRYETIELARERSGAKFDDPRPAFVYDEYVKHHMVDPNLPLNVAKLESMQQVLVKNGSLAKAGDIMAIVDTFLRTEALDLVRRMRSR